MRSLNQKKFLSPPKKKIWEKNSPQESDLKVKEIGNGQDNMGNPLRLLSPCFKAYPHFSSRFAITISDCNRDFRKKTRRRNYLAASARSVTIR